MDKNSFKINQIKSKLTNYMGLVNEQISREKLQKNVFKILLVAIVLSTTVFLIKNEGLF